MANGRNPGGRRDKGRDGDRFALLPWVVLDSEAYLSRTAYAKALLVELARQFTGSNNGRLLLSRAYLAKRGWHCNATITKAKRQLLDAKLIFETVKGGRPNKASWYAVTWQRLDSHHRYDFGVEAAFRRGAYLNKTPIKNESLRPPSGTERDAIAPPSGTESAPPALPGGAIRSAFATPTAPLDGHHLEVAICGAGEGAAA